MQCTLLSIICSLLIPLWTDQIFGKHKRNRDKRRKITTDKGIRGRGAYAESLDFLCSFISRLVKSLYRVAYCYVNHLSFMGEVDCLIFLIYFISSDEKMVSVLLGLDDHQKKIRKADLIESFRT